MSKIQKDAFKSHFSKKDGSPNSKVINVNSSVLINEKEQAKKKDLQIEIDNFYEQNEYENNPTIRNESSVKDNQVKKDEEIISHNGKDNLMENENLNLSRNDTVGFINKKRKRKNKKKVKKNKEVKVISETKKERKKTRNVEELVFNRDDSIKEVLKSVINQNKDFLERKFPDLRLICFDLKDILGGTDQNKIVIDSYLYQVLSYNEENKKNLEKLEPKDKVSYNYFMTRKIKFLLGKCFFGSRLFIIEGKEVIIEDFKILSDIIEQRKNEVYKNDNEELKEGKSNLFIYAGFIALNNFEGVISRNRSKNIDLRQIKIEKFENYLKKENSDLKDNQRPEDIKKDPLEELFNKYYIEDNKNSQKQNVTSNIYNLESLKKIIEQGKIKENQNKKNKESEDKNQLNINIIPNEGINKANSEEEIINNGIKVINNLDVPDANIYNYNKEEILELKAQNRLNYLHNMEQNNNKINFEGIDDLLNNKITTKSTKKVDDFYMSNEDIKEVSYPPMIYLIKFFKDLFNLNFDSFNCDEVLGICRSRMKQVLGLEIYQILCYYPENKKKLILFKDNNKMNESEKTIFYYFMTRTFEQIYKRYTIGNRHFPLFEKGNLFITSFKTLEKVIEEKKSELKLLNKDDKYIETKINNFENYSQKMIDYIKNEIFEGENEEIIFIKVIIDEFETMREQFKEDTF